MFSEKTINIELALIIEEKDDSVIALYMGKVK